ncbi:MAG TPA: hypothetical protein VF989_01670 [Polyangiaceae bacterium]
MAQPSETERVPNLDVFCSPEGGAFRVYVRASGVPRHLARSLDIHGEAYPVVLDFQDLDRYMKEKALELVKRPSAAGGVQLVASGDAAAALSVWLSTAISSGVRKRG